MKQIIQNYRTGKLELGEVPIPLCSSNKVLVKNVASLISIGTERSNIELGQKSLLGKARACPDLVKQALRQVIGYLLSVIDFNNRKDKDIDHRLVKGRKEKGGDLNGREEGSF